jgi:hypothetical protein
MNSYSIDEKDGRAPVEGADGERVIPSEADSELLLEIGEREERVSRVEIFVVLAVAVFSERDGLPR